MKPNILLLVFLAAVLMCASGAQAQAPAAAPAAPAGTLTAKPTPTKTELRKLFEDTQWLMAGNPQFKGQIGTYVFERGGTLTHSGVIGGKGFYGKFYAVEPPNILKIYNHDPKKDRKADFMLFRVNVDAMTAEQDTAASTKSGSEFMKYDGPAKRGK